MLVCSECVVIFHYYSWWSQLIIIGSSNLSSVIVVLSLVLINFSFEKDLSVEALIMGNAITRPVLNAGKSQVNWPWRKTLNNVLMFSKLVEFTYLRFRSSAVFLQTRFRTIIKCYLLSHVYHYKVSLVMSSFYQMYRIFDRNE